MSKKKEAPAQNEQPTDLKRLVQLAELMVAKELEYAEKEKELAELRTVCLRLEREDIPMLMAEVGLSEIKLANGKKVTLKEEVDAKITEANKPKAFAWLLDHGYGGIIKTLVAVQFGKGEHDEAAKIAATLQSKYKDHVVALDESVHHSTLKAFVKERMKEGEAIPIDLFGVYPYTMAVIKE